jgi:hypothetical protein
MGFMRAESFLKAKPSPLVYDMNFAAGAPLHADFTFTRATAAYRRNSSGLWANVASGALRYHHTAAGAPLGALIERSRTNRAFRNRDLTHSVWIKTNCTTAKDATGIDGAANSASTLTATAAAATCLQSITLASGVRIFQPWIRRKTGTGTIEITLDGGTNWTAVTDSINSSTWTRVIVTATVTNPQVGFRLATSGDEIEVDMTDLQYDGDFPTAPIPVTASVVTRDIDQIAGPAYLNGTTLSFDAIWRRSSNATLIGSSASASSRVYVNSSGNLSVQDGAGTINTAETVSVNVPFEAAVALSTTGATKHICLNGGAVASGALGTFLTGSMSFLGTRSDFTETLNSTIAGSGFGTRRFLIQNL